MYKYGKPLFMLIVCFRNTFKTWHWKVTEFPILTFHVNVITVWNTTHWAKWLNNWSMLVESLSWIIRQISVNESTSQSVWVHNTSESYHGIYVKGSSLGHKYVVIHYTVVFDVLTFAFHLVCLLTNSPSLWPWSVVRLSTNQYSQLQQWCNYSCVYTNQTGR